MTFVWYLLGTGGPSTKIYVDAYLDIILQKVFPVALRAGVVVAIEGWVEDTPRLRVTTCWFLNVNGEKTRTGGK